MIQKITSQNNNTPTKHLTHNNLKITDEKDIENHLAKTFSQNSSTKNQSKSFQIIKTKAEKVKIKFQSKNTKSYNQPFSIAQLKESLNKAHSTAVGLVCFLGFYGISTLVGYLTPNSFLCK